MKNNQLKYRFQIIVDLCGQLTVLHIAQLQIIDFTAMLAIKQVMLMDKLYLKL